MRALAVRILRPLLLTAFLAGIVVTAVIGTRPVSPGDQRNAAYGDIGPTGVGSDIYGQRVLAINAAAASGLSTGAWLGIGLGSAAFVVIAGGVVYLVRRPGTGV